MYKCRECKAIYKDKVEYCECGNNTFDEFIPEQLVIKETAKTGKTIEDKLKQKSEIISWSFFAICLILSLCIWLFAGNSTKTTHKTKLPVKQIQVKPQNIPNIDKIWDNTPIYKPAVKPQQEYMPSTTNQNPISLSDEIPYPERINKSESVKKNSKSAPIKPIVKEIKQVQQPIEQKQIVYKETPKPIVKPNPNDDPEFLTYKAKLRSALFSRFAVGSIRGTGTCIIEFSIDASGKLQGRKFISQSDNKVLNDTVYYMLMSVPTFSPPPPSYDGQKIRMKFYVNNGSYEISFLN